MAFLWLGNARVTCGRKASFLLHQLGVTFLDNLFCKPALKVSASGMRSMQLLGTVSALAIALNTAQAANYVASNETEFLNAITQANSDGDASSTITLTGNVALSGTSLIPTITKTLTIDTDSFTFSGSGETVFDTADGQTLTIIGAATTNKFIKDGTGTAFLSGVGGDLGLSLEVRSGLLQIDSGSQITSEPES